MRAQKQIRNLIYQCQVPKKVLRTTTIMGTTAKGVVVAIVTANVVETETVVTTIK